MKQGLWQDWVNLVLGVWLFLAPWFGLGESQPAAWNSWIFGLAIAVLAIGAISQPQKWEEWTNLAIGVWLILAPFVLGFSGETGALWNHVIIGVLVGADALWAMREPVHRDRAAHPRV